MNGLATASFFAFGALLVLFGANASDLMRALELDYADFGLVASAMPLGLGCGIFGAGPLVDRLPRRPLFALSCACVAVANFSLGPDTSFPVLLIASFSIGLGAGFYETLLNAVIVEQSGDGAPRRLLFIHAAATLGASVTPLAIGLLKEPLMLSWFDPFHMAGGLHVVLACGIPWLPESTTPRDRPALKRPLASAGDSGRLLLATICIATFVYVGVETALTSFVADFALNELGLAPSRAAGMLGLFWIGLLLGRLAVGFSPRAPSAAVTAGLALLASAILGAFVLQWTFSPELALALTGFSLGGVFPIMIGLAGMSRPAATGSAVALSAGLGALGGFIVPWLTGVIAMESNLTTALMTLSIWLFVLAVASGMVHRRHGR